MKTYLFLIFIILSCHKQQNDKELVYRFVNDMFIEQRPIKEVLLDYSVLTENDFDKDAKILMGYCEYSNNILIKSLNDNKKFTVEKINESNKPRGIRLEKNEKAYLVKAKKEITIVVVDSSKKITSYFVNPFYTKGNKKPYQPAYLKDMLNLEVEE